MNPEDFSNAQRLDFANQLALGQTADAIVLELQKVYAAFCLQLAPDQDIAARFSLFGSSLIVVQEVLAASPALILIFGVDESGAPVKILQHVSQLSVMLVPVRRNPPTAPRREIGFSFSFDARP